MTNLTYMYYMNLYTCNATLDHFISFCTKKYIFISRFIATFAGENFSFYTLCYFSVIWAHMKN